MSVDDAVARLRATLAEDERIARAAVGKGGRGCVMVRIAEDIWDWTRQDPDVTHWCLSWGEVWRLNKRDASCRATLADPAEEKP